MILSSPVSFPSWERGLKLERFPKRIIYCLSFPSWERGLKLLWRETDLCIHNVVPLVGTWIETGKPEQNILTALVVPLVGTWIETLVAFDDIERQRVVPLVGTWIETRQNIRI